MNRRALAAALGLLIASSLVPAGAQNRELVVASSATYAPFALENKDRHAAVAGCVTSARPPRAVCATT